MDQVASNGIRVDIGSEAAALQTPWRALCVVKQCDSNIITAT